MIELKAVNFSYGEKKILSDFSLKVEDGKCAGLSGASGSGKTTVLRLLSGLEKPQGGEVICPEKISYVFQEDRLVENLSVLKNIMLVIPEEKKTLALSMIKQAGLESYKNKKVSDLSGGMKRRVALIRAICFGGDVLLLDEPFNGLDSDTKKIMANMIKKEFTAKNKSVLIVSHIAEDFALMGSEINFSIKSEKP
ncbi:MAG: ABC transporter ATP-binding protein [Ruminococcus sp.]|nr:ABC transporter ATP-binding protein [Candidatus Copronaster equi]